MLEICGSCVFVTHKLTHYVLRVFANAADAHTFRRSLLDAHNYLVIHRCLWRNPAPLIKETPRHDAH